MSKNNDVIVQSPHDFATLVTQLMPATTVLHASQTDDIDYTTGSVGPWDDMQAIAEFVGKAGACSRIIAYELGDIVQVISPPEVAGSRGQLREI